MLRIFKHKTFSKIVLTMLIIWMVFFTTPLAVLANSNIPRPGLDGSDHKNNVRPGWGGGGSHTFDWDEFYRNYLESKKPSPNHPGVGGGSNNGSGGSGHGNGFDPNVGGGSGHGTGGSGDWNGSDPNVGGGSGHGTGGSGDWNGSDPSVGGGSGHGTGGSGDWNGSDPNVGGGSGHGSGGSGDSNGSHSNIGNDSSHGTGSSSHVDGSDSNSHSGLEHNADDSRNGDGTGTNNIADSDGNEGSSSSNGNGDGHESSSDPLEKYFDDISGKNESYLSNYTVYDGFTIGTNTVQSQGSKLLDLAGILEDDRNLSLKHLPKNIVHSSSAIGIATLSFAKPFLGETFNIVTDTVTQIYELATGIASWRTEHYIIKHDHFANKSVVSSIGAFFKEGITSPKKIVTGSISKVKKGNFWKSVGRNISKAKPLTKAGGVLGAFGVAVDGVDAIYNFANGNHQDGIASTVSVVGGVLMTASLFAGPLMPAFFIGGIALSFASIAIRKENWKKIQGGLAKVGNKAKGLFKKVGSVFS